MQRGALPERPLDDIKLVTRKSAAGAIRRYAPSAESASTVSVRALLTQYSGRVGSGLVAGKPVHICASVLTTPPWGVRPDLVVNRLVGFTDGRSSCQSFCRHG